MSEKPKFSRREQTRQRIIDAAYETFYEKGFTRSGVDAIAEQAGVTKRTLYAHFDSKDALLAAVLNHQDELALDRLRRWAGFTATTPEAFIEALFDRLEYWMASERWAGSGFTRAAQELADLPGHPAREAAARHKAKVEAWLAEQLGSFRLASAPALATQIMILIEGVQNMRLIHRDKTYAKAARAAALTLIRSA